MEIDSAKVKKSKRRLREKDVLHSNLRIVCSLGERREREKGVDVWAESDYN